MPKIISHLWFPENAREAVDFYVSTIPNSAISGSTTVPAETPSGPPGSVTVIEFRLGDQNFTALEAGPLDPFNHAYSIQVACSSQEELDRIWHAFLDNGGQAEHCGWLKDRWGLSWQIVPRVLGEMISDANRERAKRVTEAMLAMVKFDIAALERAHRS
ncbi:VOC family protein [Sinorhizobium meliloti]|uniref:VOC family protein n=1 Tax=Rhizobium meliloti TaxID=382 RepID=UPI0001E4DD67|nr:VOC family protein [Sinorhizobium meliloti]AEG09133.1 3-demethylubiquinone-9 3-methyltransferase [Sinorhizobium meliloti BL225C]ASP55603.1 VOC family protein [Sinorhizobium meliloti]ASP75517.1 VOC family protein [Sinorhizobium meliloti]ASP87920.1 VOC family protein [Sinorhizobium meliloti]ASP94624.1 VOC family protein [Sinorhizobium meliloti]